MKKSLTAKNLFDKRTGKQVQFTNAVLAEAIGAAEMRGIWLFYGPEKNGKTWFVLQVAKDLAANSRKKIAYISAEEGMDESFRLACERAGITPDTRILFDEYLPIDELIEKFSKPKTADIIFIDNLFVYGNELPRNGVRNLSNALPDKLLVLVAHEERKEPYPASARDAKKLAKVHVNIKGLKAFVVSRFSPQGGEIVINDDLSEMYWGVNE